MEHLSRSGDFRNSSRSWLELACEAMSDEVPTPSMAFHDPEEHEPAD